MEGRYRGGGGGKMRWRDGIEVEVRYREDWTVRGMVMYVDKVRTPLYCIGMMFLFLQSAGTAFTMLFSWSPHQPAGSGLMWQTTAFHQYY